MTINDLRYHAYLVLRANYPSKMSAKDISKQINILFDANTSRRKVHYALRDFARFNKHFAVYPSFFPRRILYSIYPLPEPFTP